MKSIFFCLFLLFNLSLSAQFYTHEFSKTFTGPILEDIGNIQTSSNEDMTFMMINSFGLDLVVNGVNQTFPPPAFGGSYIFCKADQQATIDWVIDYDGTGIKIPNHIVDSNDDFIFSCYFENTVDFDLGGGVTNITSSGLNDIGLYKLDANGDLIWAKAIQSSLNLSLGYVTLDETDNMYVTIGVAEPGTIDLDPGPGIVNEVCSEGLMILLKLDESGNYLWHQSFEKFNPDPFVGESAAIALSMNNIYLFGSYTEETDFDPGISSDIHSPISGEDAFICKLDLSGNYIWSKHFSSNVGPDSTEAMISIAIDENDNVLACGAYTADIDIDPNAGVSMLYQNCTDCNEIFVIKLNQNGDLLWQYATENSTPNGTGNFASLKLNSALNDLVLIYGAFGSIDVDYGPESLNLTTGINGGLIVSHLNINGDLIWADLWDNIYASGQLTDPNTIYTYGRYENPANFGTASNPVMAPTTVGPLDAFLSKHTFDLNGFSANVFSSPCSHIDSCDGTAYASVTGGVPPFNFIWEGQLDSENLSLLDSACYGVHELLIVDAMNDSIYINYVISDSEDYYNWNTVLPQDTAFVSFENCDINYNVALDSANISNFYLISYDSLTGENNYFLEVTYYQTGNTYVSSDTVTLFSSQDILIYLELYCPTKTTKHVKIALLGGDAGILSNNQLNPNKNFNLFPNPANDRFFVNEDGFDELYLMTASGQLLKSYTWAETGYGISNLTDGLYFVVLVKNGSVVSVLKMMKTT